MGNLIDLQKNIQKQAKIEKGYNTGLIGEILIVSAYKQMKIDDLEKLRIILNNIIREKKEFKRVQDHDKNKLNNSNNADNNANNSAK
jgi:hypothetical protein